MNWITSFLKIILLLNLIALSQQVMAECDKNYQPMTKATPVYPARARDRYIEGYVVVEFTVTKQGKVEDVTVVSAEPKGVFDRAAIRAVQNYVFAPCTDQGRIFEITHVPLKFSFDLGNS